MSERKKRLHRQMSEVMGAAVVRRMSPIQLSSKLQMLHESNMRLEDENQQLKQRIAELEQERDELKLHGEEVADAVGFPKNNNHRLSTPVITTNIRNMKHFCSHLDALEFGFFMVDGEPDEDGEIESECVFNRWAWDSEKYSSEFGKWLAKRDLEQQTKGVELVRAKAYNKDSELFLLHGLDGFMCKRVATWLSYEAEKLSKQAGDL